MNKVTHKFDMLVRDQRLFWSISTVITLAALLGIHGKLLGCGLALVAFPVYFILKTSFQSRFNRFPTFSYYSRLIAPPIVFFVVAGLANSLPVIGDLAFKSLHEMLGIAVSAIGVGYLLIDDADSVNSYTFPVVVVTSLCIIGYAVSVISYDYVFLLFEMLFLSIAIWSKLGRRDHRFTTVASSVLNLAFPFGTFFIGLTQVHDFLRLLFPSGLLIQYFFSIPGLCAGIFTGTYMDRFKLGRWVWLFFPMFPLLVGLMFGIEALICFWITILFSLLLFSIITSSKAMYLSGISLIISVVLTLALPYLHSPIWWLGPELRSALAVTTIAVWIIVVLLGNQSRRDWTVVHLSKSRLRKRRDG